MGFDLQGLVTMSLRSTSSLVKISLYFNSIKFPRLRVKLIALLCVMPLGVLEAKSLPGSFADLAAKLLPSVVNISTMQAVETRNDPRQNMPQFPPGSPFEEFFKDFMERNGPGGKNEDPRRKRPSRRAQSLGSGFIIDKSCLLYTSPSPRD